MTLWAMVGISAAASALIFAVTLFICARRFNVPSSPFLIIDRLDDEVRAGLRLANDLPPGARPPASRGRALPAEKHAE